MRWIRRKTRPKLISSRLARGLARAPRVQESIMWSMGWVWLGRRSRPFPWERRCSLIRGNTQGENHDLKRII